MDPLADFAQLQRHFVDQIQWRYEVIRPLVLFADRSATARAQETGTHPETVGKLKRRFEQQGMLGLLPDTREVVTPGRRRRVPETVVEEIARLIGLYTGFQYRELARIIFYKLGERVDDKTVKILWHQSLATAPQQLPLLDYHSDPDRAHARLQVIQLYAQGWSKRSISHYLHVSRPTITAWIRRFEAEELAGLADKSRAPHAPARKTWLSLMIEVYHLQKRRPDAARFRMWSLLEKPASPHAVLACVHASPFPRAENLGRTRPLDAAPSHSLALPPAAEGEPPLACTHPQPAGPAAIWRPPLPCRCARGTAGGEAWAPEWATWLVEKAVVFPMDNNLPTYRPHSTHIATVAS
jgi:transposase